ncbi:MAG TPA: DUF2254 domain-containing protein [Polyangiaceae bacterium]|nr:DUF2254 domain-containing protein [Polyangiaceae bacterium]
MQSPLLQSQLLRARSNVNLWKIPLALSLGGVALFGLTMVPDVLDALGIIHLPTWFTMGSIDDARAILSAMLGCVSTVLALIFSVALLVLSMVATLFGPRLLYRFLHDWVTQVTIGLFMATFVYLCLVFLVTHQDPHTTFIPQVSLIMAWLLVVASFSFLVVYSHRIAASIQNPDLVARIVDDIRPEISVPASVGSGEAPGADVLDEQAAEGAGVECPVSGYVQEIDHAALVAEAASAGAVVHVLFRPGQFVLRGERLASVSSARRGTDLARRVLARVAIGRHRTIEQDPEFGIAQIVEIALRALSPAVNDTFTGVACVDWMGDALLVAAEAPVHDGCWFDRAGKLRLHVRPLPTERLVRIAFDQSRQAAADNPAVLIRMLDVIRRVAPRMQTDASRDALRAEADAIREASAAKVPIQLDRKDVEAAWKKASEALPA